MKIIALIQPNILNWKAIFLLCLCLILLYLQILIMHSYQRLRMNIIPIFYVNSVKIKKFSFSVNTKLPIVSKIGNGEGEKKQKKIQI